MESARSSFGALCKPVLVRAAAYELCCDTDARLPAVGIISTKLGAWAAGGLNRNFTSAVFRALPPAGVDENAGATVSVHTCPRDAAAVPARVANVCSRSVIRMRQSSRQDLGPKRLQRSLEYVLLSTVHLFFVLSFREYFEWWMAAGVGVIMFCMNFQLTQLRERRRTRPPRDRQRVLADTVESILLLLFVVLLSLGGVVKDWLSMHDHEFLGYVAAMLAGIFLAGFVGEHYWQRRFLLTLDDESRANYTRNLRRTIIFPYAK